MSDVHEGQVDGVDPVHQALAEELEAWANGAGVGQDPVVERIIRALITGQGLSTWAGADFFEVLPIAPVVDETQNKGRFLRALQAILVFFPILFTWNDLRSVVPGYRTAVSNLADGESVSFLVFWASNGLEGTAKLVVLTIAALIATTLMLQFRERGGDTYVAVDADRRRLAVALTDTLKPRQKVDLTNVEESLTSTLEGFRDSAELLRGSTQRMIDVLDSTEALGPQLEMLTSEMSRISEKISDGMVSAIARLNEEVGGLTSNIQSIGGTLNSQVEGRINDAVSKLDAVQNQITLTGELLQQTARTFELVIERVYRKAEEINKEMQQFRSGLHRASNDPGPNESEGLY